MGLPRYLSDRQEIIIYEGNKLTNQSKVKNAADKFTFKNDGTTYFYLTNMDSSQKLSIKIKENSNVELFLILESSKTTDLNMEFALGQNATLKVTSLFISNRRTKIDINRNFRLAAKSNLNLMNAMLFSGETKMKDTIDLDGIEAKANIDLLNIGSGEDVYEVFQDIRHNAKKTISNINNYLISNNESHLSYSVSGRIFKGNEKSSCSQLNKGIILQEKGYIKAEPKLFIDEYDVEANHGAAIGQIDDEQLFYLLSRGLTELEARSLIISGYTNPFIMNVNDENIQKYLIRIINRKIKEANS